ncbi:DUF58 domain-containing protein [Salinibius halmophilus]|uniref:DUF58 domain-containing protein n=1 Tax=Salinibius halmophilus TaxID=1853216 RepID=UPI000E67260F|nr:DUF58 domain-containing protein [Salinibius halmophilus]
MTTWVSDGTEILLPDLMALARQAQQPEKRLMAKRQQQSTRRSVFHGRGMEYSESRAYQPGDEVRHLDWRLLARTGDAYSKQFHEERDRPTWLWTDLSAPMWFGSVKLLKSVQAAHLAACLGWAAIQRSDAVGGMVFGDRIRDCRTGRGRAALMRYLHLLAEPSMHWQQDAGQALQALAQLNRAVKTGGRVHLISDFHWLNEASVPLLRQLSRHNDVVAWQILDPLELKAPNKRLSLAFKSDAGVMTAVFNRRRNKAYNEQMQRQLAKQQQWLQSAMVTQQTVFTNDWLGGAHVTA